MIDIIKNSYKFEQELDYMEAKKCFNSAMENLPAFVETFQVLFDRCNGHPYKKLHTYPRIPHVSLQPPFYHL